MRRILMSTAVLAFPVLALLSLHLLLPADTAAQVRSRRSTAGRHHRTNVRTKRRDAVFIGGGASTGAIIGRTRRRSSNITGGALGAGVGGRNRRSSNILGGGLGTGVRRGNQRQNSAIGAGGAGTYIKSRRNRRIRRQ